MSGLDYLPLYDERSQLYCSREHPLFSRPDDGLTEADLAAADAVAPGYRLPPQAQALQQRLTPAATASDREGIAFLILSGRYIGYLPDHFAAGWVAQGMMRPLLPDVCSYDAPLALAVRKGRRANLVLERFLQELERSA
ncbi:LysR substrate binding domain [Chromobacterium violaceum]|uniref:LysR substrate binding domain n=1 Tax=Chromobacterium violaceum TaxID=536 RepID=A0A3S4HGU8_CHRVL|nr:LysR substrate binding domain [Chromobacterium violaceum]